MLGQYINNALHGGDAIHRRFVTQSLSPENNDKVQNFTNGEFLAKVSHIKVTKNVLNGYSFIFAFLEYKNERTFFIKEKKSYLE